MDEILGFGAVVVLLVGFLLLMLVAAPALWGVAEFRRWRREWEDDDE